MKVKRLRTVKKILNFYKNNYSITPPYRVLVDGTFCHTALKVKVNISDELPKYLGNSGSKHAQVEPDDPAETNRGQETTRSKQSESLTAPQFEILTTNCCLKELEKIGSPVYGALNILRQFPSKPCGHVEPIPAIHCLLSILKKGNPGKFLLSTVDPELTEKARNIAGVPLIFLHGSTMVLEKPTNKSIEIAEQETKNSVVMDEEIGRLRDLKKREGLVKDPIRKVRKKKKAKGPNPLAMKKKKTDKKKGQ